MDWITSANQIVVLITSLIGLIGTGIGAFFAIKNWIKATKEKSAKEIWTMIVEMADAAIKEAENSGKKGADKKTISTPPHSYPPKTKKARPHHDATEQ